MAKVVVVVNPNSITALDKFIKLQEEIIKEYENMLLRNRELNNVLPSIVVQSRLRDITEAREQIKLAQIMITQSLKQKWSI